MARISICYLTKYGNNRTAMQYLKERLGKHGHEVRLFSINDTKPDDVPPSDLYVFSTPVHVGKPPRKMRSFIKRFKCQAGGSRYALIVTHASELSGEKWSPTRTVGMMHEMLKDKGMLPLTQELLIRVKDIKGPLEDDYQKKIDALSGTIVNLLPQS